MDRLTHFDFFVTRKPRGSFHGIGSTGQWLFFGSVVAEGFGSGVKEGIGDGRTILIGSGGVSTALGGSVSVCS